MNRTPPLDATTLTVADVARLLSPAAEVEAREDEVYVNYAFSEAVVVTHDEEAGGWYATAVKWDRTHGVADEHEVTEGIAGPVSVILATLNYLATEREAEARMEAALAGRPEDVYDTAAGSPGPHPDRVHVHRRRLIRTAFERAGRQEGTE